MKLRIPRRIKVEEDSSESEAEAPAPAESSSVPDQVKDKAPVATSKVISVSCNQQRNIPENCEITRESRNSFQGWN